MQESEGKIENNGSRRRGWGAGAGGERSKSRPVHPLCSAGECRRWEANLHNGFLAACWVKKGLFQLSPEAGVAAGQMSAVAPCTAVLSAGMCCSDTKAVCSPFPNNRDSSRAKPNKSQ